MNVLNHVVVDRKDEKTINLILNGRIVASTQYAGACFTTTNDLKFFRWGPVTSSMTGGICYARLVNGDYVYPAGVFQPPLVLNATTTKLVGTLTSNTSDPNVVVSLGSDMSSSYPAYLAFNGVQENGSTAIRAASSQLSENVHILMTFTTPKTIKWYELTGPSGQTIGFNLEYFDGTSWIIADSSTYQNIYSNIATRNPYSVQTFGLSTKWRLRVTAVTSMEYCLLGELTVYGY
jgi:hypothetical protein